MRGRALAQVGVHLRQLAGYGIDISRAALHNALEASLVRCDAIALPFPDATFQYIINLVSLEHYSDIPQGI